MEMMEGRMFCRTHCSAFCNFGLFISVQINSFFSVFLGLLSF